MTDFSAAGSASSVESVAVSWAIENLGQARTLASSWNDKIYLSSDPVFNPANDIPIKVVGRSGSLDSRIDYSRTVSAPIPNGISGDYYLILTTDADENVVESDENNNTSTSAVSIELTISPDLQLTSFAIPSEGTAGQPIEIDFTVENAGYGAAYGSVWYDAVYLSLDDVIDSSDIRLSTTAHTSVLNPAGSYHVNPDVELPDYVSGTYFVIIKIDSRNDIFEHDAEGNNIVIKPVAITMVSPADLVVTDIAVPETAAPGGEVMISWTIENQGRYAAVGRIKEGVYISGNNTWEYTDPLLGDVARDINLAPGASTQMSMSVDLSRAFAADSSGNITAALPGVATGEHYVAVRTNLKHNIRENDLSNNTLVSADTMTVSVESLEGNEPLEETIFGSDQKKFYQIDVDAGLDLKVTLTSDVPSAANEIYVAYERVPTLIEYDHAGNIPFAAHQDVLVPSTKAGTYYIMVYVRDLPSGVDSQNITLLVELMIFSISGITPDTGGAGGRVTCTLTGAGFRETTKVFLRLSDDSLLEGKVVEFVNTMELKIRWDLADVPLGTCDIVAENIGDSRTELLQGFVVENSSGMQLHMAIESADLHRAGSRTPVSFIFKNIGNIDIPYLKVLIMVPTYIKPVTIKNTKNLLKKSDLSSFLQMNHLAILDTHIVTLKKN